MGIAKGKSTREVRGSNHINNRLAQRGDLLTEDRKSGSSRTVRTSDNGVTGL